MKCELCGAEYYPLSCDWLHPEDTCIFADKILTDQEIGYINAAIKQARGNTQKPDGGLWTYTRDNRQGSGDTPMEAFEQWRELVKPKKPHPLAENRKENF